VQHQLFAFNVAATLFVLEKNQSLPQE